MRVSLVVPVYNAAPFIRASLERRENYLHGHFDSFEIIAIDGGSADAKPAVLDTLSGLHVDVMRFPSNRGNSGAIKARMLESRGTCRVLTDADLPHDLEALPYMESQT
jgi:glycosyltransferase involved in cell wall biosynthesis